MRATLAALIAAAVAGGLVVASAGQAEASGIARSKSNIANNRIKPPSPPPGKPDKAKQGTAKASQ